MIAPLAITQAGDLLWSAWREGRVIEALPPACRPASRADGYAIQDRLPARSAHPVYGWKIAATSAAGQRHINVSGPLAGRLLQERVAADGALVSLAHNRMAVAEPEFAFRMARDLPPRAAAYSTDEVMAAVADLHLALELPDSRYADFTAVGEAQLIADNACAHDVVVGAAVAIDWRRLDLAAHAVHATVRGRERSYERDGIGSAVLGDPRIALAWLANELRALGIGLGSGQTVITGACVAPLEIVEGDRVLADFGSLGGVSVALGDAAAAAS